MTQWNQPRRGQVSHHGSINDAVADWLLKLTDLGLWSIVFIGPHLLGGRHMMGRFAILAMCVTAAIAWFSRQLVISQARWHRSAATPYLLTAIGVVVFQLFPLPVSWIENLSPRTTQILPLWQSTAGNPSYFGSWLTLSLAPEETRLALATLVAYALLFFTAAQRIEVTDDVLRITKWIAGSAIIVALLGIVQYFTSNGKFFWFYDYPYTDTVGEVKAGFTCRNHFAHFLVLGLANLLAWITIRRTTSTSRRSHCSQNSFTAHRSSSSHPAILVPVLILGVTIVLFAILASLSRGGLLAMLGCLVIFAIVYARARMLNSSYLLGGGVLVVIMMGALSLSGNYDRVAARMESLTSRSIDNINGYGGRRMIWSANVAAIREGGLTGSGAGSHRFIYPLYIEQPISTEYTHAENGYLQVATENGLLGIFLLSVALITWATWSLKAIHNAGDDRQRLALATGLGAALAASALHSIVDFVWFIPACMTVTILLAACTQRLAQLTVAERPMIEQPALTATSKFNLALAASFGGIWALSVTLPAAKSSLEWDAYHFANEALKVTAERKIISTEANQTELIESERLNAESLLVHLNNAVQMNPDSSLAHARLAGALLNRFDVAQQQADNSMPINQIRAAAQASHFNSPKDLRDWMVNAFGEDVRLLYQAYFHARRAIELCPLDGEAYLYLAELCFLEGRGPRSFEKLTRQALLVRPRDPNVLHLAGKSQLIEQHFDEALTIWAAAFQGAGKHRLEIIRILAGHMTAEDFIAIFSPDWSSLEMLWQSYRQLGTTEDLQAILSFAAQAARQQTANLPSHRVGKIWLALARMQLEMQEPRPALESLQLAYSASPDSFLIRYELGKCFLEFQDYDSAESHLRWCLGKFPGDRNIEATLQLALRGKMQRLARTSHSTIQ